MHIPRGFHIDGAKNRCDYVLQLKKNLYGLKLESYNWSELLTAGLFKLHFKQSKLDPCLYTQDNFICDIYVDDTIFRSPEESKIDKCISKVKYLNFILIYEGEIESFLGIKIETTATEDETRSMTQPALIDTIVKPMGLEDDSK